MSQILRGHGFWSIGSMIGNCAYHFGNCAYRDWDLPDDRTDSRGFRIARHKERPQVNRGGSWLSAAVARRPAYRNHDEPEDHYSNLGFRISRRKL